MAIALSPSCCRGARLLSPPLSAGGAAAPGDPALARQEEQQQRRTSQPAHRAVIWFHHVYSTSKRKAIVGWATELRLGGRLKSGLPGAVIAEGAPADVAEFVARVRALRWQVRPPSVPRGPWGRGCSGALRWQVRPLSVPWGDRGGEAAATRGAAS